MKKLLFLPLAFLTALALHAQPFVTVQDGDFTDPATWGGTVPDSSGYHITINHAVILNTDFYGPNPLTVNASGSLIDDATGRYFISEGSGTSAIVNSGTIRISFLNGGSFNGLMNSGIIEVDKLKPGYLLWENSGTITVHQRMLFDSSWLTNTSTGVITTAGNFPTCGENYGTINADSLTVTMAPLTNYGTIQASLSIVNQQTIVNDASGTITVLGDFHNDPGLFSALSVTDNQGTFHVFGDSYNEDSIRTSGLFHAHGAFNNHRALIISSGGNLTVGANFSHQDGASNAYVINDGDCKTGGSFLNKSDFTNNHFFSVGGNFTSNADFLNASTGTFNVGGDFLTQDLAPPGATFTENGWGYIGDDFTNESTITGSGRLCVIGVSTNNGAMTGTFDFCDNSGDSLDVNTGSVSPTVTFCVFPCAIGIADRAADSPVVIAPNPFHGTTTLGISGIADQHALRNAQLLVMDMQGRDVTTMVGISFASDRMELDCARLSEGIYMIHLMAGGTQYRGRMIVE